MKNNKKNSYLKKTAMGALLLSSCFIINSQSVLVNDPIVKAQEDLKEAKEIAIKELNGYNDFTEKKREEYKSEIDKAESKEEINRIKKEYIKYLHSNDANGDAWGDIAGDSTVTPKEDLKEAKEKAIEELNGYKDFTEKKRKEYRSEIDKAKSKEEINRIKKEYIKYLHSEQALSDALEEYAQVFQAKEKAIKKLKEAGITSDFYLNKIKEGKTVEEVESFTEELLKSHEDSLDEAKEKAIKKLKEAGITSDFYLNMIRKSKRVELIEAFTKELLDAHERSNEKKDGPDVKPIDGTDVKPNDGTDVKPNDGTNVKPNDGTNVKPNDGTDVKPNDGTNVKPNDGTDAKPNEETDSAMPKTSIPASSIAIAALSAAGVLISRKRK